MGAVAELVSAVDELAATDCSRLSPDQVRAGFAAVVRQRRRLEAIEYALYAQADSRNLPYQWGFKGVKTWLEKEHGMSGSEAWRHATYADTLISRTALSGEVLLPTWEGTALALREGQISVEHVQAIAEVLNKIPARVDGHRKAEAELALSEVARSATPKTVKAAGAVILANLNPDGDVTDERDRKRRRGVTISDPDVDNMSRISGWLDPTAATILKSLPAAWARKGLNNMDDPHSPTGTPADTPGAELPVPQPGDPWTVGPDGDLTPVGLDGVDAVADVDVVEPDKDPDPSDPTIESNSVGPPDSTADRPGSNLHESRKIRPELAAAIARDTRTQPQRNHDALTALARAVQEHGLTGRHRGVPAIPIVTMSLADLEAGAGQATTATGGTLSIPDALTMAERAHPLLMIFDHAAGSRPLYLGRSKRGASMWQRLGLYAAHRGCTGPSCTLAAAYTQIHHAKRDWADGGHTNIDELTSACDDDHALTQTGEHRWHTRIVPEHLPDGGRVAWVPPASVDPLRRPRINHSHDPERLVSDARQRLSDTAPQELSAADLDIPITPRRPPETDWETSGTE